MTKTLNILIAILLTSSIQAQEPTRWRGPAGDGIYPCKDLLKSWPADGPEILWSYQGFGKGHSSVAISGEHIYTMGMLEATGYLFKFGMDGKLVYKKPYGPEYTESFHGSRGTPTVAGDLVYLLSGTGKFYCVKAADGSKVWTKDLFNDFDGSNITWGMNETPVVDGDVIYITPGGKKFNVVALNRKSGELIWASAGKGELTAYCTPLLFEHNGRKILATHTKDHLIALDAVSGELLWSQRHTNEWQVHPNTPIYKDGMLYFFSGYGEGGGMMKLSADGSSAKRIWSQKKMDSRMGGAVLIDGYVYGSGDSRVWSCYKWETGEEMFTSDSIGHGVVIAADGMLYCYSMRGELALVEPDPTEFKVVSQTRVTLGSEQHWAHPVIHHGVLYVRHGNALIAYKIK